MEQLPQANEFIELPACDARAARFDLGTQPSSRVARAITENRALLH